MADLTRSVILKILGNNKDANAALDDTSKKADALARKRVTVTIDADNKPALGVVAKTTSGLDLFGRKRWTATIDADNKPAEAAIAKTGFSLKVLGKEKATPTITADDKEASVIFKRVTLKMKDLSKQIADPKIKVAGEKESDAIIDRVRIKLKEYAKIEADAKIGVVGEAEAIAKIKEVEHELDALKRKSDIIKLDSAGGSLLSMLSGHSGGGGGGGGLLGTLKGLFSDGGGLGGIGGKATDLLGKLPGGASTAGGVGIAALGSLVPSLIGGGLGIGVGGAGLIGSLMQAATAQATLVADQAAVKAGGGPRTVANSKAALASDTQSLAPLLAEQKAASSLTTVITSEFAKLAGPIGNILKGLLPVAKDIGGMLLTMFRASLPFLDQFLHALDPIAKAIFPAITAALRAMQPQFPLFIKALVVMAQGLGGFFRALGPGMKGSTEMFMVFAQIVRGLSIGLGVAFAVLGKAVEIVVASWKIGFQGLLLVGKVFFDVFRGIFKVFMDLWHHDWGKAWDDTKAIFVNIWHAIEVYAKAVWGIIKPILGEMTRFIVDGFRAVEAASKVVWKAVEIAAVNSWHAIEAAAKVFWHALVSAFDAIKTGVTAAWDFTWKGIKTIATLTMSVIRGLATGFWHALVTTFNAIKSGLEVAWSATWNSIKTVATVVGNFVRGLAVGFWHFLVSTFDSIKSALIQIWTTLWNVLKQVATTIGDFIRGLAVGFWHFLNATFTSIWHDLAHIWTVLWDALKSTAVTIGDYIRGLAVGFWHAIVNTFTTIWHDVARVWDNLWNGLKSVAHAAVQLITGIVNEIRNAFAKPVDFIVNTVYDGMANIFNKVTGFLKIPIKLPIEHANFAEGGIVPGVGRQDTVPAMLTPGERVLSLAQVDTLGGHSAISAMVGSGPGNPTHFAGGGNPNGGQTGKAGGNPPVRGPNPTQTTDIFKGSLLSLAAQGLKDATSLLTKIAGWGLSKIETAVFGPILSKIPGGGIIAPIAKDILTEIVASLSQTLSNAANSGNGSLAPYKNPLRGIKGLVPERIDMGVDYAGGGPLYALGPGKITSTRNSGWPGGAFIGELLSQGAFAGKYWYEAENIVPSVHVGQTVDENTVVGNLINAPPHSELGWAAAPGTGATMAAATGNIPAGDPGGRSSNYGVQANELLVRLGAPSGIHQAGPTYGKLNPAFNVPKGFSGTGGQAVYSFLLNNLFGGNRIAAAGATASIWGESGWNPEAAGTGGRGLIGWTPPSTLPNSAFTGNASRDMASQLPLIITFVNRSGDQRAIQEMKAAGNVASAASIWDHQVERAGISDVHGTGIALATKIAGLAKGGIINEPIAGVGLRTGTNYMLGEEGPEMVTPMRRASGSGGGGGVTNYYITPPESANNPDAYAKTVIQALRTYKRHRGNQSIGLG